MPVVTIMILRPFVNPHCSERLFPGRGIWGRTRGCQGLAPGVGAQHRRLGFPHWAFEGRGFVPGGMKGSTCDLVVSGHFK